MLRGETVKLLEKTQSGVDAFGTPIYTTNEVEIDNVIIGSPTFDAQVSQQELTGKKIAYILGIPKGDTHDWRDKDVEIRGELFRTYGYPLTQTSANVPGKWNTQVKVERYE